MVTETTSPLPEEAEPRAPGGPGDERGVVDCREAVHRLYHFLDGELTVERRRAIEAHLDSCSPCWHAFGFEVEIRHLVASRCRERVPEELRARVAEALARAAAEGSEDASPARRDPARPSGGEVADDPHPPGE